MDTEIDKKIEVLRKEAWNAISEAIGYAFNAIIALGFIVWLMILVTNWVTHDEYEDKYNRVCKELSLYKDKDLWKKHCEKD